MEKERKKNNEEIKLSNKQTTMIWKLYGIELKMIWKRKKTKKNVANELLVYSLQHSQRQTER